MTIKEEAKKIVYGDREETYGHPSINFYRTAVLWSVILGHRITLRQVALMMAELKVAREVHEPKRDNLVDYEGYHLCIEKMIEAGDDVDALVPGFDMADFDDDLDMEPGVKVYYEGSWDTFSNGRQ